MIIFDCKYGVHCKNYEDISKCDKCVYIDDGLSQFEPDKEDSISHDAVLGEVTAILQKLLEKKYSTDHPNTEYKQGLKFGYRQAIKDIEKEIADIST